MVRHSMTGPYGPVVFAQPKDDGTLILRCNMYGRREDKDGKQYEENIEG